MRVAVVGASGYTGLELLRLLVRHPELEIVALTSERQAGTLLGDVYPAFRGVLDQRFEAVDAAAIAARAEFAFAALPHTASAPVVRELVQAGVSVVDLSADFRLRNAETYAAWYGAHRAPELLGKSVYGIPELHRAAIREAQLVAAPGCYPTSVLLPLAPFLRAGLGQYRGKGYLLHLGGFARTLVSCSRDFDLIAWFFGLLRLEHDIAHGLGPE